MSNLPYGFSKVLIRRLITDIVRQSTQICEAVPFLRVMRRRAILPRASHWSMPGLHRMRCEACHGCQPESHRTHQRSAFILRRTNFKPGRPGILALFCYLHMLRHITRQTSGIFPGTLSTHFGARCKLAFTPSTPQCGSTRTYEAAMGSLTQLCLHFFQEQKPRDRSMIT